MIFEYLDDSKNGIIKAGMTREEVQNIFNTKIYEFKKISSNFNAFIFLRKLNLCTSER